MALGHIRPHGDGKWRIFVYIGTDPLTGIQRKTSRVINGSRRDAERALIALQGEVNGGHHGAGSERTLGDALRAFIDHKTLQVAPATLDTYRHQLAFIPERVQQMPIGRIDVEVLEALYAHLRRQGHIRTGGPLSVAAVKNVHAVIRGSLELARRRKWIVANPALDAELPSERRRRPSPAPAGKLVELLAAAADQHHALPTYLRLTLAAGARRGEVHGLRWANIDFDKGRITFRETVGWADGRLMIKPSTKTGEDRTVTVGAATIDALRALHDRAFTDALTCGATLNQAGFVFTDDPVGDRPWHPATTARRFKRACEAAGIPGTTRLHDLRHLMATHLIDQAVPVPVVSARLGHSLNSTTLDIYTGRVDNSDGAAAEIMDRLIDG